jgi:hypothetical protein
MTVGGRLRAEANPVVDIPARCRDLEDSGVVGGALVGIEIGIDPMSAERSVADRVGVGAVARVDGRFERANAAEEGPAIVAEGDVVDLLYVDRATRKYRQAFLTFPIRSAYSMIRFLL